MEQQVHDGFRKLAGGRCNFTFRKKLVREHLRAQVNRHGTFMTPEKLSIYHHYCWGMLTNMNINNINSCNGEHFDK